MLRMVRQSCCVRVLVVELVAYHFIAEGRVLDDHFLVIYWSNYYLIDFKLGLLITGNRDKLLDLERFV